jgi:hypothetical protein
MRDEAHLGAKPEDWIHFDIALGLGPDLLPVVCDYESKISANSSIKKIGKVPSLFNKSGEVVGFKDWTSHQSSDSEITRWMKNPKLGICIQTRGVRGLDVDVPDREKAKEIADFIDQRLSTRLPKRIRPNTGKFLVPFRLSGEHGKREFPVQGGIVEFLGDGQQFVSVGTHESGVRYEWEGGLPVNIPTLEPDVWEDLWVALVDAFAIGAPTEDQAAPRKKGSHIAMPDDVADYLRSSGLALTTDKNNNILIKCPWEDQHTGGSTGDGSTIYFPAGTNGYMRGHYKCLHAHCRARTDEEFSSALGYVASLFEVLPVTPSAPLPLPNFSRDRTGRINATVSNATLAVRRSDICGIEIALDLFRDEIMKAAPGSGQWQTFTDADYTRIRIALEKHGFKAVSHEMIRQIVCLVAEENQFDSAQLWLGTRQWDGKPRVETFFTKYFGVEDSLYARAVSNYLWTALAGRVMSPGVKADMVPILVGPQGAGKSTGIAAMVPSLDFFTEISFHEKEEDLSRKMRGRLIAEISELRGLSTKDLESVKAFCSRQIESWVPKFREFAVNYSRRLVPIGTTNSDQFLADETGNRRFLPLRVKNVRVDDIRRDCVQLWAEGREMFQLVGVCWAGVEDLAKEAHEEHTITDAWEEPVSSWLVKPYDLTNERPIDRPYLLLIDVLSQAINMDARSVTRREEMRIAKVLRKLGYKPKKVREGVRVLNGWFPARSDCSDWWPQRSGNESGAGVLTVPSVLTEVV